MHAHSRLAWLALTPDPERELPYVAATLRAGRAVTPTELLTERRRVERLILRGTRRAWLRYLREVGDLVRAVAEGGPGDLELARVAGEVLLEHHRMLIGLPGDGYQRMAPDRVALEAALPRLTEVAA
jgi:hypothetical protein